MKKKKLVTMKDVRKKMKEMGITGGYDWHGVTPEQHMAYLDEIQRRLNQRLARRR